MLGQSKCRTKADTRMQSRLSCCMVSYSEMFGMKKIHIRKLMLGPPNWSGLLANDKSVAGRTRLYRATITRFES